MVKTMSSMNVLGITFQQNLNWSQQVYKNINGCQRSLHGIKTIRKYFNQNQLKDLVTSFVFSKLFYAFEVWSNNLLNFDCKQKLDSFYYKCCRVVIGDFYNSVNRGNIDAMMRRARPEEFSDYCCARSVI